MLIFHSKDKFKFIRQIIIILLLFAINLRPMIVKENEKVEELVTEIDVLFVIDNTISMKAEDYNGSIPRMSAVKRDCSHIIASLPGARFSVVKFENKSMVMIPFTTDANKAIQCINTLSGIDKYNAKGSSMNVVKEDMKKQLDRDSENEKMVVFFISDGEITNEDKLESFSDCASKIDDGAVLGYGTETGGKMQIKQYDGTITYLEDPTEYDSSYKHPVALSKIDEKNLKKIASDMNIDYIHMEKQADIDAKLEDIKNNASKKMKEKDEDTKTDLYYIFLVPLVIVIGYEIIDYKKKIVI